MASPSNSMKVIVGTNELPTPLIASMMYYITYNPYWHAPDHLVRKTIAPNRLQQGIELSQIARLSMSSTNGARRPTMIDPDDGRLEGRGSRHAAPLVRQDPGPLNSMGILKFPFPNPEDIYLHDTPSKALFAKSAQPQQRLRSGGGCQAARAAGCSARIRSRRAPTRNRVQLPQGVPIFLTYLTAQVRTAS